MSGADGLISVLEAAEILGVTPTRVEQFARAKLVERAMPKGSMKWSYRETSVRELAHKRDVARAKKNGAAVEAALVTKAETKNDAERETEMARAFRMFRKGAGIDAVCARLKLSPRAARELYEQYRLPLGLTEREEKDMAKAHDERMAAYETEWAKEEKEARARHAERMALLREPLARRKSTV